MILSSIAIGLSSYTFWFIKSHSIIECYEGSERKEITLHNTFGVNGIAAVMMTLIPAVTYILLTPVVSGVQVYEILLNAVSLDEKAWASFVAILLATYYFGSVNGPYGAIRPRVTLLIFVTAVISISTGYPYLKDYFWNSIHITSFLLSAVGMLYASDFANEYIDTVRKANYSCIIGGMRFYDEIVLVPMICSAITSAFVAKTTVVGVYLIILVAIYALWTMKFVVGGWIISSLLVKHLNTMRYLRFNGIEGVVPFVVALLILVYEREVLSKNFNHL